MPELVFPRRRIAARIVVFIALAAGMLDGVNAIAGDRKSTAPNKNQAAEVRPLPQCEHGRYWCAKRYECIKVDVPCQYQKNDFAF
jgi:hypothetical protein